MAASEVIDVASESEEGSSAPESKLELFDKYEDKTDEVKKQFVVLANNQYINRLKSLYSATNEFMTCDCTEELDSNNENQACGPYSDCINRLTNIECVDDQCNCGDSCLNQRFQRREYADISIFLTGSKGYGMRANRMIPAHTFIIEYMGDVIDSLEYKERKERYDKEGIKHFYFMMMQDNEIIDATKRASLGRYCNHSCDPNAFIEKWVVDKRYRMGIFAKRDILKGEEICFDYNVDRYGAEPQKCFCGASNCLGVMGGKTQSETVRLLPHVITEALGVRASDEKKWLKLQKKNGNKVTSDNIDSNVNVEFVKSLDLDPADLSDIAKLSSCLMQPELDLIVISRILERLLLEGDEPLESLLVRFNRLHGIQALGNVLKTVLASNKNSKRLDSEQKKILVAVLTILEHWPELKVKNSIQNGEVEESLQIFKSKGVSNEIKSQIDSLIELWSTLEVVYRIPKKHEHGDIPPVTQKILDDRRSRSSETPNGSSVKLPTGPSSNSKQKQPWGDMDISLLPENKKIEGRPLPPGWEWAIDNTTKVKYFFNRTSHVTQWKEPKWDVQDEELIKRKRKERELEREKMNEMRELRILERERALKRQTDLKREEQKHNVLSTIIAKASKAVPVDSAKPKTKSKSVTINEEPKILDPESTEYKEKKWISLFAKYIPNVVARYEKEIGKEKAKHFSKELAHMLASKEMKRHPDGLIPSNLSEERKLKTKGFVKDYMSKVLKKIEEKKRKYPTVNGKDESKKQKL